MGYNYYCIVLMVIVPHLAMGMSQMNSFSLWGRQFPLPAPIAGLDYTFYDDTCPQAEGIVRSRIDYFMDEDITQAAGLLRLFFQDCFVHGCDGSVLLTGSASGPWDTNAAPNMLLRPEVYEIIDDIKMHLEAECPQVVSCADIISLAARDAILAAEGPYFPIPTGRRDGIVLDTAEDTLKNIPPPTSNVSQLLKLFKSKGLDVVDLVALSGAHTLGKAHCSSFSYRLQPLDPRLNKKFALKLLQICPANNSTNATDIDYNSPREFDNKYYKHLKKQEGLFTSDEDLFYDARTRELVMEFEDSEFLFFLQFALSAIQMSQMGVLTGADGEIRLNCSQPNFIQPPASPSSAPIPSLPSPSLAHIPSIPILSAAALPSSAKARHSPEPGALYPPSSAPIPSSVPTITRASPTLPPPASSIPSPSPFPPQSNTPSLRVNAFPEPEIALE
eukprot:Gb_06035 [translate_table: standard]